MSSVTCPKNISSVWSRIALVLVPTLFLVALVIGEGSGLAGRRAGKTGKPRVAAKSAAQPAVEGQSASREGRRTASNVVKRPAKVGAFNPDDETVDMFQAMEDGRIAVKLIPKDSTEGRIFVQNKAGKPLNVKLPPAFAARPVLAQMGMMGGAAGGMGGGGQGMGGGGGMGMMNVPAEKTNHVKVACVCLEHGKPEPRSRMTYEVKPIESFTTKPGVKEMLVLLGDGKINQRAAQVAAWHLNNGLTWEQLIGKKIEHADGSNEPYFSAKELQAGMAIVSQALADAEKEKRDAPSPPSPGETALSSSELQHGRAVSSGFGRPARLAD